MTTEEQIRCYLQQPRRYFNIDGLGEIGFGVMMLSYSMFAWLAASGPDDSLWNRGWFWLVYLALTLTVIDRGTKLIKKRVTYPRTGFVEYRRSARDRAIRMLAVAAAVPVLVVLDSQRQILIAPVIGILFAMAYAYHMATAMRWKRLVAVVLAVGSLAIASLPISFLASVADVSEASLKSQQAQFASWHVEAPFIGATILVSGGITLYQYLRQTHAPDQAAE